MKNKFFIKLAAILGMMAVAIGAFGAHGLESLLIQYGREATFETAVKYHFYHTLAIFLVGVLLLSTGQENKFLSYSVYCFLSGIVVFSGSLYLLSLTNASWLGAVTPIGGVAFILGWIFLFIGAGKKFEKIIS
jgi:uncharacterized membrane protein YgdD (TMEM256/DUF423 family)